MNRVSHLTKRSKIYERICPRGQLAYAVWYLHTIIERVWPYFEEISVLRFYLYLRHPSSRLTISMSQNSVMITWKLLLALFLMSYRMSEGQKRLILKPRETDFRKCG
jgi:hypothetical protein